jgi:hypothetical protein
MWETLSEEDGLVEYNCSTLSRPERPVDLLQTFLLSPAELASSRVIK